ncbi:MAG: PKD domain protein [Syntrophorhabdaceae bacterium PtaU1.Bin034]|nr:MAG: PKD domain protein [Syntrophorhabdaceae bacterium PtaU1.Bin034]
MRKRVPARFSILFLQTFCFLFCLILGAQMATGEPLDEWQSRNSGTTSDLYNVVWNGQKLVTVGLGGSILTSWDGISWNGATSGTTNWLYGVAYGNGTFVASGQNGTIVTSSDGNSWTQRSTGTSNLLYCAAFGSNRFVVVGTGGTILTSTDGGNTWTRVTSGVSSGLFGVTYGNGRFVVVGESGVVLTSNDGVVWTQQVSNTGSWLDQVAFGNGLFVAAGQSGTIITSRDATNWTQRSAGTTDFYCIAYGNGIFVAVGAKGTIFSSLDGVSWTRRSPGVSVSLRGVTFGVYNTFVVTGFNGTILESGSVAGTPIANAGQHQTVQTGTVVTLDGSGSSDPDGDPITYSWTIESRPSNSTATLTNITSVKSSFVPDVRGSYTVKLVVTDSTGLQSRPSTVTVTAGALPLANAGSDKSGVKVGTQVVLDGSGSSDPDGNVPLEYSWTITAKPAGSAATLKDATSAQCIITPDQRWIYTVSLVVTNSIGLQSQPSTVSVSVGSPPVANAGADQSVLVGETVVLDGSGCFSPDAATPLAYEWTLQRPEGSSASMVNLTTARPNFIADIAGSYTATVVVTDKDGFRSQHDDVVITATQPTTGGSTESGGTDPSSGGGGGGGCFIATAVYGSSLAPEVAVLKRFRDSYLLTNLPGRYIVHCYYRLSPPVAAFIEGRDGLKLVIRGLLRPVILGAKHPFLFVVYVLGFLGLAGIGRFIKNGLT